MAAAQPGSQSRHDEVAHRSDANRAVGLSALGLAITGVIELGLAVFTNSVGLLGDALHNLSDVSTSALVFFGFRISRKPASTRYPYGLERAEDVAGLGVALVIWGSAVFAGIESYFKFVNHGTTSHVGWGMVGAVVGMVGNQLVARYKGIIGRRIQSATLVADARHSWLDAISSLGALAGLVLVALGHRWGDPLAGFAVTAFILHVGYEVTAELLHHLMDGVEPESLEMAQAAAHAVPGVLGTEARGRWTGRTLRLEVVALVNPTTTLGGGGEIGRAVQDAVFDAVNEARVVEVVVRGNPHE
ncbi:MAG: cation diffusion facilitator family transporter [Acidimicrobiales bacterium]